MAMGFGGPLAWLAFLASIFLFVPTALVATHVRLRSMIRPLAAIGLTASGYTLANGVAYLRGWDAGATYVAMLGAETGRSEAETVGALPVLMAH